MNLDMGFHLEASVRTFSPSPKVCLRCKLSGPDGIIKFLAVNGAFARNELVAVAMIKHELAQHMPFKAIVSRSDYNHPYFLFFKILHASYTYSAYRTIFLPKTDSTAITRKVAKFL